MFLTFNYLKSLEDLVSHEEKERIYSDRMDCLRSQLNEIIVKELQMTEEEMFDKFFVPNYRVTILF